MTFALVDSERPIPATKHFKTKIQHLKSNSMKTITLFTVTAILLLQPLVAQDKYICRNGHIWFHSEAPMETIEGHNRQVSSVLDASNGNLVFQILMKSFQFEKALMQEHFNENYVESDKFPKSSFSGQINDFELVDLKSDEIQEVTVAGELTIHGVTQPVSSNGTLQMVDGKLVTKSTFQIAVADYDIKIPGVVKENISKIVDIHVDVAYEAR